MLNLRFVLGDAGLTSVRALESVTGIADTSLRRQASRFIIDRHHQRVGGLSGRIGVPLGDLRPLGARGFVKPYSGGTIELLDFTNGPQGIQRYRAEVRFVGYRVVDTNEDGDGDEPYFIVGIVGTNPDLNITFRTNVPEDLHVKADNNVILEQTVTTIAQPPFTLSVTAMDHDSGEPDDAAAKVTKSLNDFAAKVELALPLVGVDPTIGAYAQSFLNLFGGTAGDIISGVLGMGDDRVGQNAEHFFAYDADKMEWQTPKTRVHPLFDRPHNVELSLSNGDGGAYIAFFNVQLFNDSVTAVPAES